LSNQRRLGRGLEALLGRVAAHAAPPDQSPPDATPEDRAPAPSAEPDGMPAASDPTPEPSQTLPQPSPAQPAGPETQTGLSPLGDPGSSAGPSGEHAPPEAAPPSASPDAPTTGPIQLDVRQIESNPFQPRQHFDSAELQALCDSLRTHGLLQPLLARKIDDRFQLIAGERRLQAATKAGWTHVPVLIVEADDRQVAELAIVENLQRKDLNPLEKAASFQRYLRDFGATQEELAARLNLHPAILWLKRNLAAGNDQLSSIVWGRCHCESVRALFPHRCGNPLLRPRRLPRRVGKNARPSY